MNADGSDQTNIATTFNEDAHPNWSADCSKIAFDGQDEVLSGHQIYVMNADGSGLTMITSNDGVTDENPSWSPDGKKIAFESNRDNGDPEIYVMNADGSGQTRLTTDAFEYDNENAQWSPDGTKIAFVTERDGNEEIYLMNPDGSSQTNLSDDLLRDDGPNWSPDGNKLAFEHGDSDETESVWVMNADGTGKTMLTDIETQTDENASWSPDGTKLAFVAERNVDEFGDPFEEIYVMDADGSDQTRLTDSQGAGGSANPDWGCTPKAFVGGEIIPIDMTALFVAGIQSSAIWILPAVAGVAGAGAYFVRSRMNKD